MIKYIIQVCFLSILLLMFESSAKTQTINPKDTTITIKVKGITCPNDCSDISIHVKSEQGIKECKSIGKPSAVSKFEVTFNPILVSYNDIIEIVENTPGCVNPNDRPYKVKGKRKKN